MFRIIEAERCTHLSGVPTSYLAMLDHPARTNHDMTSLVAGSCGGADCNPDVLKRCAAEFPMPGLSQVYGQTEGGTLFACPEHDDRFRWETAGHALPECGRWASVAAAEAISHFGARPQADLKALLGSAPQGVAAALG